MTGDIQLRSGLCHGPACLAEITEKSASRYFHTEGCQARWQAAHAEVGSPTPYWSYVREGWVGFWPSQERIEALRPDLSLGARHHLTGGEYVVTESEPGRAVLTPVEEAALSMLMHGNAYIHKPRRRSWWKPNTWRRHG